MLLLYYIILYFIIIYHFSGPQIGLLGASMGGAVALIIGHEEDVGWTPTAPEGPRFPLKGSFKRDVDIDIDIDRDVDIDTRYRLRCSADLVSRLSKGPYYRACYGLLLWLKGDTSWTYYVKLIIQVGVKKTT